MGRTLHLSNPPMKGLDVAALQKALAAAKLYNGEVDATKDAQYTASVAHACEVAKFRLGYSKSQIHPHHETADAKLTALLQGHAKLSPAQKLRRRARLNIPSKEQAGRAATVAYWHWMIANAARIAYNEHRPMTYMGDLEHLPILEEEGEDCSTAATKGAKAGGFKDPNGLFYGGQGYTGTMLTHCRRLAQHQVQPADLVVFVNPREPAGHHVCQVLSVDGDDMTLGSHGRELDPRAVSLSQEAVSQASMGATEIHFLQVAA